MLSDGIWFGTPHNLALEWDSQALAAQMPAAEKATRADYVITTDGTFEQTDAQLDAVLTLLLR